jgi:hypothetical protein
VVPQGQVGEAAAAAAAALAASAFLLPARRWGAGSVCRRWAISGRGAPCMGGCAGTMAAPGRTIDRLLIGCQPAVRRLPNS